jgi:hypothetical protein
VGGAITASTTWANFGRVDFYFHRSSKITVPKVRMGVLSCVKSRDLRGPRRPRGWHVARQGDGKMHVGAPQAPQLSEYSIQRDHVGAHLPFVLSIFLPSTRCSEPQSPVVLPRNLIQRARSTPKYHDDPFGTPGALTRQNQQCNRHRKPHTHTSPPGPRGKVRFHPSRC